MVIFKKILSTFVDLGEEVKTSTSPAKASPSLREEKDYKSTPYQEAPEFSQNQDSPSNNLVGIIPESHLKEIEDRLEKVLEEENKKNFPGADYYEFEIALENMRDVPLESARYLSAFKVLSATQGLTREHLVETAQAYLKIIDRELGEFNLSFESENKTQVENKEKSIEIKSREMQELSHKISTLNEEIKKMNLEMVESKNRLGQAKNSFMTVAQKQKEKINNELKKIQTYIQ